MSAYVPFTGSYTADDVEFLLKPITMVDTPIAAKEALIQSGQKHYSQLLSHECLPPPEYLALFEQALTRNKEKLAGHALILARGIVASHPGDIALVSLARAGTPIGVLLKHLLQRYFHVDAKHYSVSIIRDVGLDANALRHILKQHAPASLVFVDGWTGKGVIARQLAESLAAFAASDGVSIPARLHVLTDLSGSAATAASSEDYLIPSCILNATVSGLVSRTIYDPQRLSASDFHGCVFYRQFAEHDLSAYFVEQIATAAATLWRQKGNETIPTHSPPALLQEQTRQCLTELSQRYRISHSQLIKPGIGEATRALLRRGARLLLLQDPSDPATEHLRWLAENRGIPSTTYPDLPYRAVTLIKELS